MEKCMNLNIVNNITANKLKKNKNIFLIHLTNINISNKIRININQI